MFHSTVLEVAVGLCFTFSAVALMTSAANEALSSLLKLRARTLLAGMKVLLNDPQFNGLARDIYNHALTNPRGDGMAQREADLKSRPSYIDAQLFAQALTDALQQGTPQQGSRDAAQLGEKIAAIQNAQIRQLLNSLYHRADGQRAQFEQSLAAWFNQGMERVGGAYKRRAQLISFMVALSLAVVLNIDAITLCQSLWQHPALVAQLDTANPPSLAALAALPVGWQGVTPGVDPARLMGWLITASSALFGAPFWFDTLQKITTLRGTGKKA